jgi:hypothetical protein
MASLSGPARARSRGTPPTVEAGKSFIVVIPAANTAIASEAVATPGTRGMA